jgi:hypothetical protein
VLRLSWHYDNDELKKCKYYRDNEMTLKDFSKRPCGKKFFQTLIMRGNGPHLGFHKGINL